METDSDLPKRGCEQETWWWGEQLSQMEGGELLRSTWEAGAAESTPPPGSVLATQAQLWSRGSSKGLAVYPPSGSARSLGVNRERGTTTAGEKPRPTHEKGAWP